MSHREIRGSLADLALGRLGAERRAEVEKHVAACPDCRDWVQTYRVLGRALESQGAFEHPDGAELAAWAVLGDELPEEATAHLAACAGCRHELELLHGAIAAARAGGQGEEAESERFRARRRRAALAWAAAAAFLVLGVSMLVVPRDETEREYVISGGTLAGAETIAAASIHASRVEIQGGSEIVFEAAELVTLGEGFVVASGATFEAGTNPLEPSASSQNNVRKD